MMRISSIILKLLERILLIMTAFLFNFSWHRHNRQVLHNKYFRCMILILTNLLVQIYFEEVFFLVISNNTEAIVIILIWSVQAIELLNINYMPYIYTNIWRNNFTLNFLNSNAKVVKYYLTQISEFTQENKHVMLRHFYTM